MNDVVTDGVLYPYRYDRFRYSNNDKGDEGEEEEEETEPATASQATTTLDTSEG